MCSNWLQSRFKIIMELKKQVNNPNSKTDFMTGINALFPSDDARRALKGVRKILVSRVLGTYVCARAARRPWRRSVAPRLSGACDTSAYCWHSQYIYYWFALLSHHHRRGNIYVTRFSELVTAVWDFLLVKRVRMTDSYDKANRRVQHSLSRALHTIMHSFLGV